jgi:hypothetical protein
MAGRRRNAGPWNLTEPEDTDMTRFPSARRSGLIVLAAGLALPAVALAATTGRPQTPAVTAVRADVRHALSAIAAHRTEQGRQLLTRADSSLASIAPNSPALQEIRQARRDMMDGHRDRAMQDLYGALPLVHAPA